MISVKKASIACAFALTVATGAVAPVYAETTANTPNECSVKMVGTKNTIGDENSRWVLNSDGTVSGDIVVSGDDSCMQTVTLAAWQAPDAAKGRPYDAQKLVGHVTETLSVGKHTLSIQVPDCYFQIDMVRGANAAGTNGTPVYPKSDMMGSLHGGTKACEEPVTPPVTVTPGAGSDTPAELPNAGVGTNVMLATASAMVLGTAFQYIRSLKRA